MARTALALGGLALAAAAGAVYAVAYGLAAAGRAVEAASERLP